HRQMVDGLFLSSGIFKDPDTTQARLTEVLEAVRRRGFKGYIHLKVMPGTSDHSLLEAAARLGTRLSINMEAPSEEHLGKLSRMKQFNKGMLEPMRRINQLMQEQYGGAVGQATQLVVGAADESDRDIHRRMRSLYGEMGFKRVYYSAFRPVRYTPLEEHPPTPAAREHRLYQLDWLTRIYGYSDEELRPAFDDAGFLELRADPKLMIAVGQSDRFPVDVNTASERDLLRVPGVGPTAAQRIVLHRREHSITRRQELQAMGVVLKRALPFLRFPGHKPEPARQGSLPLFEPNGGNYISERQQAKALHEAHAPHGCAGCPLSAATCGMPTPARSAA
ncbi:MAG: helix-hairpin-helix domain-containing protein, partial [Dehalococcoidia bacterium]